METWKEHQRSKKDKKWMKFRGREDQDQDQPQELQEEDVEGVEAEEQKREEEKMKDLEVRVFRIVLPMTSKNSNEVMNTAIEMLLRFKVDGYDVNRIHTDRGKEFMGAFKKWARARGCWSSGGRTSTRSGEKGFLRQPVSVDDRWKGRRSMADTPFEVEISLCSPSSTSRRMVLRTHSRRIHGGRFRNEAIVSSEDPVKVHA